MLYPYGGLNIGLRVRLRLSVGSIEWGTMQQAGEEHGKLREAAVGSPMQRAAGALRLDLLCRLEREEELPGVDGITRICL